MNIDVQMTRKNRIMKNGKEEKSVRNVEAVPATTSTWKETHDLIFLARKRDFQLIDTRKALANETHAKNAAVARANRLQNQMDELKALYMRSQEWLEESLKVRCTCICFLIELWYDQYETLLEKNQDDDLLADVEASQSGKLWSR